MKYSVGVCVFLLCMTRAVAAQDMTTNTDSIDPRDMEADMVNISPGDQDEMLNVTVKETDRDEMMDKSGIEPAPEEMYVPLSWDLESELDPK